MHIEDGKVIQTPKYIHNLIKASGCWLYRVKYTGAIRSRNFQGINLE